MTPTPSWESPARTLAEFVTRTNRLPVQSGATTDDEKKAGNILRRFRRMLAQNEMDEELRAWLDENIPSWATDNTRPRARGLRGRRGFAGRVAGVARFVHTHGHLPSPAGRGAYERELGVFLRNHRQAAKGKGTTSWNPSKQNMLNRRVPGWDRTEPAGSAGRIPLLAATP